MITKHIADLLYFHECVIVPGLGGFIKAFGPARIHATTHEFCPPSSGVAFNAGLSGNDGILANHIASVENTTFREALYEIKQWVDTCNSDLKKGERVVLEGIGDLFLNASGRIEFTPSMRINFNPDAYGLPVFFAKAVELEPVSIPEIQPLKQTFRNTKIRSLVPETLKWAAVLAPFIAFTLWGSLNGNIINNYTHNYTGMFSWVRSTPGKTATRVIHPGAIKAKSPAVQFLKSPAEILASENIAYDPGMLSYHELAKNNVVIADAVQSEVARASTENQRFYVIGGAFRDRSNADKLIGMLKAQGYPASVVDTTPNGLYIVSMKGFNDFDKATQQLAEVKKSGFSSSWILKKRKSL